MVEHRTASAGPFAYVNPLVNPMLTDYYQVTMAYALWCQGRHLTPASFELFFRKSPFDGEFTIFAGVQEVQHFLRTWRFDTEQITVLRAMMPNVRDGFFQWLASLDLSSLTVYAMEEGSVVFPREPLLRVEGPLALCQLVETTLLCLVNYPSLVATNAMRLRLAVGPQRELLEFGLRRAQGPDGAVSASRYAYLGGCDGTSNVLASAFFGIPPRGTHAHSYIMAFESGDAPADAVLSDGQGVACDLYARACYYAKFFNYTQTNIGELVALAVYAKTFPTAFVGLVDTYDTLASGVPNFICVAAALREAGHVAQGIRLDSGDLSYLSNESRKLFTQAGERLGDKAYFAQQKIVASNDLNEATIIALNRQGHSIDAFAVGTHLVTCQAQAALGCVYKMVSIDGRPRIKLSHDLGKVTIPGRKAPYRLFGKSGRPLVDLLVSLDTQDAQVPRRGEPILCLHPFEEQKRVVVTPDRVEALHSVLWEHGKAPALPTLNMARQRCHAQIAGMREDHIRYLNPTPYKVAVNAELYRLTHDIWLQQSPIKELN